MRVDRLAVRARKRGHIPQQLLVSASRDAGADRHGVQVRERSHPVLRHTDINEVLNADLCIEPVTGLHLAAAAQAEQDRAGDVPL